VKNVSLSRFVNTLNEVFIPHEQNVLLKRGSIHRRTPATNILAVMKPEFAHQIIHFRKEHRLRGIPEQRKLQQKRIDLLQ